MPTTDESLLEQIQVCPDFLVELLVQPPAGGTSPAIRESSARSMWLPLTPQPQDAADHAGDALPALGFAGELFTPGLVIE